MRREKDLLPAVLYGKNTKPIHISVDHNSLWKLSQQDDFYAQIITVDIAGQQQTCILKDLARHPYKEKILHMDLLCVHAEDTISKNVRLRFINQDSCIGVKQQGGQLSFVNLQIRLQCVASKLPRYIDVDVSKLELGSSIKLSEIDFPVGVSLPNAGKRNDQNILVKVDDTRESRQSEN